MNLDAEVVSFINQFAHKSPIFDHVVTVVGDSNLLKGAIPFSIFWALWFMPSEKTQTNRKIIVGTLTGCTASIVVARLLALMLPFRARPMNDLEFNFVRPFAESPHSMEDWSSFPSDHAALFFGLVAGIYMISRPLGFLFFLQVCIFIIFPRLYLGIHYPTDLLAGAVIGGFLVWLMNKNPVRERLSQTAFTWMEKHPFSFYACFFLITYQFVSLFDDVRDLGRLAYGVIQAMRGGSPWED